MTGVSDGPGDDDRIFGVTIGIVTNVKDPKKLGRVQVTLPTLADDLVSDWARVVAPMAGKDRGVYFPPEVDDEVLVAFEHGDPEFPYVLGGLWNGKDRPPEPAGGGRHDRRVIRSRSGHVVRFVDTANEERIEIVDGSTKNRIVIGTAKNTITIAAEGEIRIEAGGNLVLSGAGVEITSTQGIAIEAKANASLKADARLEVSGRQVAIN